MLIAKQVSSRETSPTRVRFFVIFELKFALLIAVLFSLLTYFVPHVSYRYNVISRLAELLAKRLDMHINGAALTLKVITPHLAEQLFSDRKSVV